MLSVSLCFPDSLASELLVSTGKLRLILGDLGRPRPSCMYPDLSCDIAAATAGAHGLGSNTLAMYFCTHIALQSDVDRHSYARLRASSDFRSLQVRYVYVSNTSGAWGFLKTRLLGRQNPSECVQIDASAHLAEVDRNSTFAINGI